MSSVEVLAESSVLEDPALPPVSFDVRLGKYFKSIDFDYASYIEFLREKGLSDEQIAKGAIKFNAKGIPMVGGVYSIDTDTIIMMRAQAYEEKTLDKILVQKTQHRIDVEQKAVRTSERIINAFSNLAFGATVGGLAIDIGIFAYRTLSDHDTSYLISKFTVGALATNLLATTLNPLERRARKTAKKNTQKFVKTVRI